MTSSRRARSRASPPPPPIMWPRSRSMLQQQRRTLSAAVQAGFGQLVGGTRLVYLRGPSEASGCSIYGKCEWEGPGGSIKDRAAWWMVRGAEEDGILRRGERGLIVEGTAGNTGIGLALAAASLGYDALIVLPNTQSQEKKDLLRQAGATVVEVPAVPFRDPNNFVHVATRMAERARTGGEYGSRVFYANQWDNMRNRQAHFEGTGPELWEQLGGKLDAFSCAIGTGGTLTGVAQYLRSVAPDVQIALTDPHGAALVRYFEHGELKGDGSSISEGIGQGRVTGNIGHGDFRPDMCLEVGDDEMMEAIISVHTHDGLAIGTSAGVNVAGAMRVARHLGPGHTLATVLCDRADRYASKLYDPAFLQSKGLRIPPWLGQDPSDEKAAYFEELRSAALVTPPAA
mmetsp:Transcript_63347/g.168703  ORF Transcript_63347/g.168703 Transcript_63347/m.168703 type:complete len:400 (+) Transcript_63347:259-1458(+)